MTLSGVNATAGAISIEQLGTTAATLRLTGRGTLAAVSSNPITVNFGGTLDLLNNASVTPAASNRADRIADGRPIFVGGGTISFTGHGNPTVDATETLGGITLNPGAATLRNTAVSGGGRSYAAILRTKMRAVMTALVIFLVGAGIVIVLWVGASDVLAARMTGETKYFAMATS